MTAAVRFHVLFFLSLTLVLGWPSWAEPLHVYLTYSDSPETTIDVNILQRDKVESVDVHFDTRSREAKVDTYRHHIKAEYRQSLMELSDRRALYVARLTGLKPGETYYFVAGEAKYGLSKERKFRTLPGGNHPFRFVNGGDMGPDGLAIPLQTLAGKEDPDFALIGGDLAYVNGLLGGFATWDKWLDNWDNLMVTTDGRMVPIVAAIGNHEVNRYASENDELRAPWYIGLFGRQGEDLYYSRRVGENAVFFILDSGHLNPHAGPQTDWLQQELEKYKDVKYKFAAYHVPLYPAHRPFEGMGSQMGRTHWGPLFDRYGLTAAFEHHDHVFKRSKPIKGGEVVEQGTIYVGDGCFGRAPRTIDPQVRWYNEKEKAVAHFWVVDVTKKGIRFKAIDHTGATIDAFELP